MKKEAVKSLSLILFILVIAADARAQQAAAQTPSQATARPNEPRVALSQAATAYDAAGQEALGGRLRTQSLAGTPDAPVRNTRVVVENRSAAFYTYASGWVTFYGEDGVRCGEGLWKLEALAPQEQVEVDTPGLRLTCAPATWRIVATTLLTRTGDAAQPTPSPSAAPAQNAATSATAATASTTGANAGTNANSAPNVPPLEINVNGKTVPVQLGNPLEIQVGKERVRIVVQQAP
jgi:hypothetical protein